MSDFLRDAARTRPPCVPFSSGKHLGNTGGARMNLAMSGEREQQALGMIEALRSVGVPAFNLTRTDINGHVAPEGYRPGRSIEAMRLLLPAWIRLAWEFEQSLIVRAHKPAGGVIAQLDDLKVGQIDRVREMAFLTVETSRGNFQVWIAIEGGD